MESIAIFSSSRPYQFTISFFMLYANVCGFSDGITRGSITTTSANVTYRPLGHVVSLFRTLRDHNSSLVTDVWLFVSCQSVEIVRFPLIRSRLDVSVYARVSVCVPTMKVSPEIDAITLSINVMRIVAVKLQRLHERQSL